MSAPYWGLLCAHHGEEIRRLRPTVIPPHVWETGWIMHLNQALAKVDPTVSAAIDAVDVEALASFAPSCCKLTDEQRAEAMVEGWIEVFMAIEGDPVA